jgi:hypothetical protein
MGSLFSQMKLQWAKSGEEYNVIYTLKYVSGISTVHEDVDVHKRNDFITRWWVTTSRFGHLSPRENISGAHWYLLSLLLFVNIAAPTGI